jgi:hypothetical protein
MVMIAVSLALFIASLPVPALYGRPPMGTLTGWDCLLNGWYGVSAGYLAWLANLLYLPLLITLLRRKWKAAVVLGAIFVVIALLSVQYVSPALDWSSEPDASFNGLGPGFWLWLASGVVPLLGAIYCRRIQI